MQAFPRLVRDVFTFPCVEICAPALPVLQRQVVDDWTRVRTELIVIREGTTRTFNFDVTLYSGQELRDRLESIGFSDVKLYGNLTGEEYGFEAERLIAVARKPKGDPGTEAPPNHSSEVIESRDM
jgi:hypothetical protein